MLLALRQNALRHDDPELAGQTHGAVAASNWQEGEPKKSFWTGVKQVKSQQHEITTWRCERCGFLESYAA